MVTYDEYLKIHTDQGHHHDGACPKSLWEGPERLDQATKDILVRTLTARNEEIRKSRQRLADVFGEVW